MVNIDLTPSVVNLSGIRAGDRNSLRFYLHQGATPFNLTGFTIAAQARETPLGPLAVEAVVEGIDEGNGVFYVRWPGDDVRTLLGPDLAWIGVWDLQLLQAGYTDALTVIAGSWSATQDVTRPGMPLGVRAEVVRGARASEQVSAMRNGAVP